MENFISYQTVERMLLYKVSSLNTALSSPVHSNLLLQDLAMDLPPQDIRTSELVTYFRRAFALDEAQAAYLLQNPNWTLWTTVLAEALNDMDKPLVFFSSNDAKTSYSHRKEILLEEAEFWAQSLDIKGKFWVDIPFHHFFGFMFGYLLPDRMEVQTESYAEIPFRYSAKTGDYWVTSPSKYRSLLEDEKRIPSGVRVLTGAQCMPKAVIRKMREKDLTVIEILKSLSKGGLAFRKEPKEPFTLLPIWQKKGGFIWRKSNAEASLGSQVQVNQYNWLGDTQFFLSRQPEVYTLTSLPAKHLESIARQIQQIPGVKACWVKPTDDGQELKCWIIPEVPYHHWRKFKQNCFYWMAKQLPVHFRPKHICFRDRAPLDAFGKVRDWEVIVPLQLG